MDKVKLAVIFYSGYGTNFKMAQWAKDEAEKSGAEVRLLKVQELIPDEVINANEGLKAMKEATKDIPVAKSDDLVWADALIFSAGSRFGNIPSQLKNFLDMQGGLWAQGKLANKVVSAMSSAQNPHGGQEGTVKTILSTMMHWGAIIVTPGFIDEAVYGAGGNPYGTSATVAMDGSIVDNVEPAVRFQARRTVEVASWIKKGRE
ncbi:NAD(P)H:quinone oxidoreductase type IV [Soehngenia longivitae]|jgi:NAD(P)H dehydrogenase (quinone)|uniref:NAD(P)H:quinone oxidoreductase type IV n=1 Tax=Soehngenia longivitae TaxID=2562294 RepID=A0A4Z0D1I9_9FIRM|nr:NAD(P)H:quinone oxidoreductase type IV [Soehngenia longivitae]TFZ39178.1 NAD(P)H:quinone oxidoreductase type IV [Soehngenia longivitae]